MKNLLIFLITALFLNACTIDIGKKESQDSTQNLGLMQEKSDSTTKSSGNVGINAPTQTNGLDASYDTIHLNPPQQ